MASPPDFYALVRAHVAARWPNRPAHVHDDIAAESLHRALESNPALRDQDQELVASAKQMADGVVTDLFNAARRGHRVVERARSTSEEPLTPRRRKRSPTSKRPPKGLTALRFQQPMVQYLPSDSGRIPNDDERLMAARLAESLRPILMREPADTVTLDRLQKIYRLAFETPAESAWADVLVEEIASAKRDKLEWERNAAGASVMPEDPTASYIERLELREDGAPLNVFESFRNLDVNVRLVRKSGDREIYEVTRRLNDEFELKAWIIGTRSEEYKLEEYNPQSRAALVLVRSIERLVRWSARLPQYVLDYELIAWLVERMGFEGGGGRSGTMTASSMRTTLVDPALLLKEIETWKQRIAERSDPEIGPSLVARFDAMARRVRERAGGASHPHDVTVGHKGRRRVRP